MKNLYSIIQESILDDEDELSDKLYDQVIAGRIEKFLLSRFSPFSTTTSSSQYKFRIYRKNTRSFVAEITRTRGTYIPIAWHQCGVENIEYFLNKYNEACKIDSVRAEGYEPIDVDLFYDFKTSIKVEDAAQWKNFKHIISAPSIIITGSVGSRGYDVDLANIKTSKIIIYTTIVNLVGKCRGCKQVLYSRVTSPKGPYYHAMTYNTPYVEFHTTLVDMISKEETKV